MQLVKLTNKNKFSVCRILFVTCGFTLVVKINAQFTRIRVYLKGGIL